MNRRLFSYTSLLLASVILLSGCTFFARRPPLPKQASVERLPQPATGTDFSADVENADIIYFPTERAASGGRSEPAARLLEALEKRAQPFAIGWDMIDASQQPLLDQLETARANKREELIAQLDLAADGRAREHCRAVLRETRATAVQFLALRGPRELLGKISIGDRLTSEEEKLLPRGYKILPKEGGDSVNRAELVALGFVAEAIVRSYHAASNGHKLIVFVSERSLQAEGGLPYLVAQKLNARQLVFGPSTKERPKLMTQAHTGYILVSSKS